MIKTIITDIEGTTSSIEFVADTLFPYARQHLPAFIRQHYLEPDVASLIQATAEQAGITADVENVINQLLQWIDNDVKATPLKTLQGKVWQQGYENGTLKGHVFTDAADALRRWSQTKQIVIYSSGSVQDQKLLFGYSEQGNLTDVINAYFDTNIGHKREAQSYSNIIQALGIQANEALFLSDVWQELEAAKEAGLNVLGLTRGVAAHPAQFNWVDDFDQVEQQSSF